MTSTDSDAGVTRILEGSVLLRGFQGAVEAVLRAGTASRGLAAARIVRNQYQAVPLREQVQLFGLALIAFAMTYLALTLIVPERAAPLYPMAVCGAAGLLGAGCLASADALANAWRARARRGAAQKSQA